MLLCFNALARRESDTLGVGTAVCFVENQGQWEHPFRYETQLHDAALFLEDDGITVALRESTPHPAPASKTSHYHAYRMRFAASNTPAPEGLLRQLTTINYILGSTPANWRSNVPQYDAVGYSNLYDNIDFEIFGASRALKYNFIVHPGGDPSQIIIVYEGTDGVEVTSQGYLRIKTSVRDVIEMKPYVYQSHNTGKETEVRSRWRVSRTKEGLYRAIIEVGDYNHDLDLVIDPTLVFSTYTGSTADNWGTTATYDSQKNVYTAGLVFEIGYPVSLGAYQNTFGGNCDMGIFKFDSTGTQRIFATYIGGNYADMPHSLFVNSFDELIVFGTTGSLNYPVTPGAFQTVHAGGTSLDYIGYDQIAFPYGSDIVVSRLSTDGTQLLASTYVGGSSNDGLNYHARYNNSNITFHGNDSLYYSYSDGARGELITDDLNNVYIGSSTFSADFPVSPGCLQSTLGGRQDGVVFKLDYNLRTLLWSTYLGGSMDDAAYSIDVDTSYNLLVCGGTNSANFPTTDSVYQTTYGGGSADGFVCKISYGGEHLMASSFVGSQYYDQLYFVRTGRHNEVFLFGQTKATGSTMIYNAGYSVPGAGMLLLHMDPDLRGRRWSTVFGTPGRVNLSPTAFAADICNRVYAAGWGRDFVPYEASWYTEGTTGMETSPNAHQDTTDGQDFYIISLDANANNLEYATFFGESHKPVDNRNGADHVDGGTSRFDRQGTLYQSVCASCGGTQGFPVSAGVWSESNLSGRCNNALFRFNVTDDSPVADFRLPETGCAPYALQLINTGRGASFEWDFGDGSPTSTETNPTHVYTDAGTYTITLIAHMPNGCTIADTQRHTLHVLTNRYISHAPETACNHSLLQIGVPPFLGATYHWTGDPVSDSTIANPWVDTSGTYILHTIATGCDQVDTFHVFSYTLVRQWQPIAVSCHDSADGQAVFQLNNYISLDSVSYTITPSRPSHIDATGSGAVIFDDLVPGITYHVILTGYGCSYEQDVRLDNPPVPAYTKEYTAALCDDSCNGSIHIHYNFSANPEVPELDTLIDNLCPGTYYTHLTALGCPLVDTSVIVRDHTLDNFHAWANRTTLYLGDTVGLHASDGAAQYLWSPAADIDHPDAQHPTATPSDSNVCYTVIATTATGCSRSDTVCLHCPDIICGEPEFIIPNAFTPNGDGVNDRLCFNADLVREFHIAVFNRWGQCVYESDDATQCWDGTFRHNPALAGVYTYTCHIRCHNGVETDFKGDITLIR